MHVCLLYTLSDSTAFPLQMEQIKRANRMYTNDSIFQKQSLSIPVLSDLDKDLPLENGGEGGAGISSEEARDDGRGSDLSPVEFLKRLDGLISRSKQAAVRGCQEAEKRCAVVICLFSG